MPRNYRNYQYAGDLPQGERRCPMAEVPCRLAPDDCPYHKSTEARSWLAYDRDQVQLS